MKKTLYEISNEYQFLLNALNDEETGEVDQNVLALLNEVQDTAQNKCINVVKVFKELEKEHNAISEERKRMAAREKAFKNKIDSLKEYLRSNMERCQIKKIECPQFVISLQKNPLKTQIVDEKVIPDEYKKITIEYDTAKMKLEMMAGVIIPGATLVQGNSVRIK